MTPQQIMDSSRQNLNAISDTLWSDSELLIKLYQAEIQLARRTKCIEATHSTSSVIGTATISFPTYIAELWRVVFDGSKLQLITQRQADEINFNASVTQSGTPRYYTSYARVITLYPTPDTVKTVIFSSYDTPSIPTASSTLEVPSEFHDALVSGLTYLMVPKDLAHPLTVFWRDKWANDIQEVETAIKRRRVVDRFNIVQTEENALSTNFGIT